MITLEAGSRLDKGIVGNSRFTKWRRPSTEEH